MTKIPKERVVLEHPDGRPHFTVSPEGLRHYCAGTPAEGEVVAPVMTVTVGAASAARPAPRGGPAQVSSDAFRTGWDGIDWSNKRGQPS